jgi:hypothetical protein
VRQASGRDLLTALLFIFCWSIGIWASTATVVPTGDSATDSWNSTPLYSKVDEDIDSPGADTISSGSNPTAPGSDIVFTVTCPADVDTITSANLRIYIGETNGGGRTTSGSFTWSATTATNISVANLAGGMAERTSGNQPGLSISKAACDSSTITISTDTTGTGKANVISMDAVNIDITYTATSGPTRWPRRQYISAMIRPGSGWALKREAR